MCEECVSCRRKITAPTEKELRANPTKADAFRRDQRGIVVKRFDEVPVADVEIVFPDKSVGLKLLDLLTLYGTAIAAFIGGVTAFFGAQLELSYVLSTLGVVGGKLFQVRATPLPHPRPLTPNPSARARLHCPCLAPLFCFKPHVPAPGWSESIQVALANTSGFFKARSVHEGISLLMVNGWAVPPNPASVHGA